MLPLGLFKILVSFSQIVMRIIHELFDRVDRLALRLDQQLNVSEHAVQLLYTLELAK